MRVLFYMVICASFYLDYRLFKVRSLRSRGGDFTVRSFHSRDLACLDYQYNSQHIHTAPCGATSAYTDAFYVHYSRMIFGCFSRKSTFLKIFLLIYLSYTLPSSAERRAGEDRENNGTTPRQQKVLFVNICHRHWLFSARGYPREKSPPFFVHYPENIRDILVSRHLLCFCQWSGKILVSFLSLPLAVMLSRFRPRDFLAFKP